MGSANSKSNVESATGNYQRAESEAKQAQLARNKKMAETLQKIEAIIAQAQKEASNAEGEYSGILQNCRNKLTNAQAKAKAAKEKAANTASQGNRAKQSIQAGGNNKPMS